MGGSILLVACCLFIYASEYCVLSDSAPVSATATATPSSPSLSSSSRVVASPLAKKLAREAGLDLSTVLLRLGQGDSGPNGRLIAQGVLTAAG